MAKATKPITEVQQGYVDELKAIVLIYHVDDFRNALEVPDSVSNEQIAQYMEEHDSRFVDALLHDWDCTIRDAATSEPPDFLPKRDD